MKTNWFIALNTSLAIGIIVYLAFFMPSERTAFFYNEKVFNGFKGKVELEDKLIAEKNLNKKHLDSLAILINSGRSDIRAQYEQSAQQFSMKEQELTQKYTADIWRFINESVKEYGATNRYDYIFGASGDGSLMFAREDKDVTKNIVDFVNQKYTAK